MTTTFPSLSRRSVLASLTGPRASVWRSTPAPSISLMNSLIIRPNSALSSGVMPSIELPSVTRLTMNFMSSSSVGVAPFAAFTLATNR